MTTKITTNKEYNFETAENDTFSWTRWDENTLFHKPTGYRIYQMMWVGNDGFVTSEVESEIKKAALLFWNELLSLRNQKPEPVIEEVKHGFGYCNKCGTYCYGDCEAN